MSTQDYAAFLDKKFPEYLEDLKTLVRIPSVSFPGFPPEKVHESARGVAALMKKRGLENVEILELPGAFPYVYGDHLHAPGKPTLLLYAHHDVQPPGREDIWKSEPFEPTVRPGPGGDRLYARGAADDKAGVVVHTSAVAAILEVAKSLPLNVKVIIEGEEEIGSTHLQEFLMAHQKQLQADVLVLTDTSNFDCGVPSLTVALRGLVGVEIEVRALKGAVHSGVWGGPIPDPAMALSKMLATLTDERGLITVPGVLEMVRPVSVEEKNEFSKIPFNTEEFRTQSGLVKGGKLIPNPNFPELNPFVQTFRLPSLTVNALEASSRKNAGNIINDTAWAKVTIRVAAGMDPAKVQKALLDHLKAKAPDWGLEINFKSEGFAPSWSTVPAGPAFECAKRAMRKGYGKDPLFIGSGGTIPFVQPFAEALGGAPALLVGVEDPYTNAHGENESLLISDLKKAILSQIYLFTELAENISTKK